MGSLLPGQDSLTVANDAANRSGRFPRAQSSNAIVSLSLSDELMDGAAANCPDDTNVQWENVGIIPGLSESDFMSRQRYLTDNSRGCVMVSQSGLPSHGGEDVERPNTSSSVHRHVKEQRRVLSKFKGQPWPMEMKKAAFKYYKNSIWQSKPEMNRFDKFRDSLSQALRRAKIRAEGVAHFFTIGNNHIKTIEGRFGSSVASFFTFLRWICALNLGLALTVVGFLMIPQVLSGHGLEVPQQVQQEGSPVSFLFDGKGYVFEYSILFYGYYDSGNNEPHVPPPPNPEPYIGLGYKLPLAYILVMCALFVISIGTILVNMAEKYKLLQRSNVSEQYPFSWKVFSGWDHAITHAETAGLKSIHLANSLRETISETEKLEGRINLKRLVVRLFTNSLVVLGLVSTSYAIVLAVENAESTIADEAEHSVHSVISQGINGVWQFILSFQVQIVIVCRNFILPWVFRFAEYFEKHHPRTALKLMLIRMFILYTTSLYVLIIALLTLTQQCGEDGSSTNSTSSSTSAIATLFQTIISTAGQDEGGNQSSTHTMQTTAGEGSCCWETTVGQELFKLSWSHMGTEVASLFLIEGGRWLIVKFKPCRKFGLGEFNLADNILRLVYGQALVWLGVFFCPLLPVIMFTKTILLFYIRVFAVRFFNRPPKSMFKVASTRNFYMALLLLMSFLCIFPVGYAAIRSTPSTNCGPFRGLTTMVDTVNIEVESWPEAVQQALGYLRTATVLVPLFGLLCIIVYYYAALSNALKEVNKDLMLQLHVERKETRSRIAKESLSKKKGAREVVEEKLESKIRQKQGRSTSKSNCQPTHKQSVNNQLPRPLPQHYATPRQVAHVPSGPAYPGAVISNPHVLQVEQPSQYQGLSGPTSPRGNTLGRPMIHHHTTGSVPGDCLQYV